MQKLTLYDFIRNQINQKILEGKNFIDTKWLLNDYYKVIQTPTSRWRNRKPQMKYIILLLSRADYIAPKGFGIYKLIKQIPLGLSSTMLRKFYDKNLK